MIAGSRNFAGCSPSNQLTNLPNVVVISLMEVEIWSIIIFNVRRRIHMIILQSVTIQFRRLFWHISYYRVWQSNFSAHCDKLLSQSASSITKCDRLLLQSAWGITKWDSYYKVRRNKGILMEVWKWYLYFHRKIICRRFCIITAITFWIMRTRDIWNLCLQRYRNNRIC